MKLEEKRAVLRTMQENSVALLQSDGDAVEVLTDEVSAVLAVGVMEHVTKRVLKSERRLFKAKELRPGIWCVDSTKKGQMVLDSVVMIEPIQQFFPLHEFNPYVALPIRVFQSRDIPEAVSALTSRGRIQGGHGEIHALVTALNNAIEELREEGNSKEFKRALGDFIRTPNDNTRSLRRYIKALFDRWSRLLVLRIDLGYVKPKLWMSGENTQATFSETRRHVDKLMRALREKILRRGVLVGHVGRIEYGLQKGMHVHLLLFLNGAKACEDVTINRIAGEYWKHEATLGQGVYFNCNAHKEKYRHCGIGMIEHADSEKMFALVEKAAMYLTKPDYYIAMAVDQEQPTGTEKKRQRRTFFKGVTPKPKCKSKGGAPRRKGMQ